MLPEVVLDSRGGGREGYLYIYQLTTQSEEIDCKVKHKRTGKELWKLIAGMMEGILDCSTGKQRTGQYLQCSKEVPNIYTPIHQNLTRVKHMYVTCKDHKRGNTVKKKMGKHSEEEKMAG